MTPPHPRKMAFYANSSAQVLFVVAAAIALSYLRPATAIAMKPLGDAFIRLITMPEIAGLLRARVNFGAVHRPGGRQYRAPEQRIHRECGRAGRQSGSGIRGTGESAERFEIPDAHHSRYCRGRLEELGPRHRTPILGSRKPSELRIGAADCNG
jgi:hypothetical protein